MLELPEILTLTSQLNEAAAGKMARRVLPSTKVHKFCWFSGDPVSYDAVLRGRVLRGAEGFGIYAELDFGEDCRLSVCDGVLQDILFAARIHPKRKLRDLTEAECERLLSAVVSVLDEMTARGGRDTEKDLFGRTITKEAYLGGSVYYCPVCQRL